MRLVEVEKAECQHLHSWNYDPDKVIRGRPVEPLTNGQLKCMDCGEFFCQPPIKPPRYTLPELKQLAAEYADEQHCEARLTVQLSLGCFVEWLAKREQGKDGG